MAGVLACLPPLLLLLTSSVVEANSHLTNDQAWQEWKTEYAKSYASSREEAERRELWAQEVEAVAKHNKRFEQGLETYTQAVFEWADKMVDSWACLSGGSSDQLNLTTGSNASRDQFWDRYRMEMTNEDPEDVDYRRDGFVTTVDDQRDCAACWAFSVVGAVEANRVKHNGPLEKLSVQQIIDCNIHGDGCHGGMPDHAMSYASNDGLMTAQAYPYVGQNGNCGFNANNVVFNVGQFSVFHDLGEIALELVLTRRGPLVTNVKATGSFRRYSGGIFTGEDCGAAAAGVHTLVLIVGLNTDNNTGMKYWILKNSRGTQWGENGYMRMERGRWLCSIGLIAVWPNA